MTPLKEQIIKEAKKCSKCNEILPIGRKFVYCRNCYHKKDLLRKKVYRDNHKEEIRNYQRIWRRIKRAPNPKYRLDHNISAYIAKALRGDKSGVSWQLLVGYTIKDLILHLESKFDSKMSWNNYGSYWCVDHIKPKSLFNYNSPNSEEFKKCWSLSNLQPLEKIENIKKKNKYNPLPL